MEALAGLAEEGEIMEADEEEEEEVVVVVAEAGMVAETEDIGAEAVAAAADIGEEAVEAAVDIGEEVVEVEGAGEAGRPRAL